MYFNKQILSQIRSLANISIGSWDELCLLCGVFCGPSHLLSRYGVDDVAQTISREIFPGDQETLDIVRGALFSCFSDEDILPGYIPTWLPDGMGSAGYSTGRYVAIGCFGEDGGAPLRDGKVPDGQHVEVRHVRDGDGGDFNEVLVVREDGEEAWEHANTSCSVRGASSAPNIFLCERCYAYLNKWLDERQLPSRPCSPPLDSTQLSLAAELYEIVNSRKARRDEVTGLLPDIDYDGIEASLKQWQSHFMPCRRGSKHLAGSIKAGLRGGNLIPAILQDCRAWMFMRPDVWPSASPIICAPTFTSYTPTQGSVMPRIGNLPNELLLPILHDLTLPSLLALSATCRSLRAFMTAPAFLDRVLQEAITHGSLRWLLPVDGLLDEHARASAALQTWLPEACRSAPSPCPRAPSSTADVHGDGAASVAQPSARILFMSPHLDRVAFVHACWQSDSMMNRKRLWGQVQQFEALWTEYRLNGWQGDRFYS